MILKKDEFTRYQTVLNYRSQQGWKMTLDCDRAPSSDIWLVEDI